MKWIGNPFPGNGKCEIQSKMCPTAVQDKCTRLRPSEWRGKQLKELLMKQGGESKIGVGWGEPKSDVGGGELKSGGGWGNWAASGLQLLAQAGPTYLSSFITLLQIFARFDSHICRTRPPR